MKISGNNFYPFLIRYFDYVSTLENARKYLGLGRSFLKILLKWVHFVTQTHVKVVPELPKNRRFSYLCSLGNNQYPLVGTVLTVHVCVEKHQNARFQVHKHIGINFLRILCQKNAKAYKKS